MQLPVHPHTHMWCRHRQSTGHAKTRLLPLGLCECGYRTCTDTLAPLSHVATNPTQNPRHPAALDPDGRDLLLLEVAHGLCPNVLVADVPAVHWELRLTAPTAPKAPRQLPAVPPPVPLPLPPAVPFPLLAPAVAVKGRRRRRWGRGHALTVNVTAGMAVCPIPVPVARAVVG